jgi:hypothetical protein
LALLEFVCVAGIAVRMVEKGRKAFEKECPSTARVVHRRARMCTAHCRRLRVHRLDQELVRKADD